MLAMHEFEGEYIHTYVRNAASTWRGPLCPSHDLPYLVGAPFRPTAAALGGGGARGARGAHQLEAATSTSLEAESLPRLRISMYSVPAVCARLVRARSYGVCALLFFAGWGRGWMDHRHDTGYPDEEEERRS